MSLYFVITTTATVGYGDVSPATSYERIFCIFLMVIGVTGFTFVSGALSSIMQNHDSLVSETQEKLLHLNRIKDQTNIPEDLYNEIRSAITFDAKRSNADHEVFLQNLPLNLRMELTTFVHHQIFKKFDLFISVGNKYFITWIST